MLHIFSVFPRLKKNVYILIMTDLPDSETCDRLCKEFAQITDTDTACGHFFLQDCDWSLEIAVNRFFQKHTADNSDDDSTPGSSMNVARSNNLKRQSFKLISWNIDGLDDKNRGSRTKAVCTLIKREKPMIIFLQEVVNETFKILQAELNEDFLLIPSNDQLTDYFTAVLLCREHAKCDTFNIIPFPTSQMLRSLLQVEAKVFGKPFVLMTTHLESTKPFVTERVKQLRFCFDAIKDLPPTKTVLFGGDLNLRDKELMSMEDDFPEGLNDAWQLCGSKKDVEFTWDCRKNDNIEFPGKFKPKCRFDRIFVKHADPPVSNLVDFRLIGLERIRSCLCFPSDHFGVCCEFTWC